MHLTDLASIEEWEALENDIHRRFNIDANVFDVKGIRITQVKNWVNRLCPAIKAIDKGQSFICAVAHMNLATMARNSGEAVIEECDAGLVKIVVPIVYQDDFLGAFGACGVLLEDGEIDAFLINKVTDMPEEQIGALSQGVSAVDTRGAHQLIAAIQQGLQALMDR